MPLLEINQSRHISASVRLDEATAAQVDQYAAFIQASADDVVDKALNYVFSKDRDFQDFLKTPQAKQVASTLRVRKAPSNGAAEEPTLARQLVFHFSSHGSWADISTKSNGVLGCFVWPTRKSRYFLSSIANAMNTRLAMLSFRLW